LDDPLAPAKVAREAREPELRKQFKSAIQFDLGRRKVARLAAFIKRTRQGANH
jgi:hypothetical protein